MKNVLTDLTLGGSYDTATGFPVVYENLRRVIVKGGNYLALSYQVPFLVLHHLETGEMSAQEFVEFAEEIIAVAGDEGVEEALDLLPWEQVTAGCLLSVLEWVWCRLCQGEAIGADLPDNPTLAQVEAVSPPLCHITGLIGALLHIGVGEMADACDEPTHEWQESDGDEFWLCAQCGDAPDATAHL